MSVYKEGFTILDEIQNRSKRIFADAADFGVPVKKDDRIWNDAKQLADWYGVEGTRKESRYSTGRSVEKKVELIDEWAVSDERMSVSQATKLFLLTFVSCNTGACKGYDGYINIEKIRN